MLSLLRTGRKGDSAPAHQGRAKGRFRAGTATLALVLLVVALGACASTSSTYPLDVFPEMHYQPSHRVQEPERLPAPSDSVTTTGREASLTTEQAAQATNPVAASPETLARARQLYQVNCSSCHGQQGHGDGVIAAYFKSSNVNPPADLRTKRLVDMSDGLLFYVLTNGLRDPTTLVGMPSFRLLLSEQDRWTVIHMIRQIQQAK